MEAFPDYEYEKKHDAADDHLGDRYSEGADLAPAVALPFDKPEYDREQASGGEEDAHEVPAVAPARPDVGDDREGSDQGGDPDGDVDEEDPAAVDVGDDGATQGRPGDGRETGHATPDAKRGSAPLRRKGCGDDRKCLGGEDRASNALQDAGRDELVRVLRNATQRGRERKYKQPDGKQVALSVKIAEPAGGDQQHRIDEDVSVQHPQDLIERCVEPVSLIAAHSWYGHVDDRGVQQDHEKSQREHQQDQPGISACLRHDSSLTSYDLRQFRLSTPAFRR